MEENFNEAANIEEIASPQIDSENTQSTETEAIAKPTEKVESKSQETDITQTQAFSRRLKEESQKAIDAEYSRLYGDTHNIHSKADYDRAISEQKEQERLQELVNNQGVPEDIAKELIESKKFREQYEAEKQSKIQQEAKTKDYEAFLSEYPTVKADEILPETWAEVEKGKSLVDAYARQELKQLKAKVAEYEKGSKTAEINAKNGQGSTGSLTGNGGNQQAFYTREQVNAMSISEINKNYKAVMESQRNWK